MYFLINKFFVQHAMQKIVLSKTKWIFLNLNLNYFKLFLGKYSFCEVF